MKREHQFVLRRRCFSATIRVGGLAALAWLFGTMTVAVAQSPLQQDTKKSSTETPANSSSTEMELTEGLLDLLDDSPGESTESSTGKPEMKEDLTPSDLGLDGEDLGEASSNPLRAVRQSMMIAAGYLERGITNRSTQVLQGDIVQRLDELIEQIESSGQNAPKPAPQENSQQSEQDQQSKFEKRQREVTASEQAPKDDEVEQNLQKGTPGQTGVGANVVEALKDPQELQKAVWGNLPERVRRRMQSRMVEQFLPSYREQIEAYYRSLLKEPR